MVEYLSHTLIIHLLIFQTIILLVILSNMWILHRAKKHTPPGVLPMVSILVPARNEERNIANCVHSLLAQDYPFFEVIVYDDQSTDATRSILEQITVERPKLKVMEGIPLPEGRLGKNWACVQLARQAQGDLLLFTDADTMHQPQALRRIVTAMLGEKADLLTGFPRQEMHTWGERLLVPFFSWALYCFNSLGLAYGLRVPVLSSAVGQMMLFRREAYQVIGGHERVADSIIDDLMLARQIKSAGLRWRFMNLTDLVSCRMYQGSREAFDGFSKNLFAAFDFHLFFFYFAFFWLAILFLEPLFILALSVSGKAPLARLDELAITIGLSLLLWLIPYLDLRIPFYLAFLYPLNLLEIEVVAFRSLRLTLTGQLSWKDRALSRQRWKWF
jgi:chlorobactene glucosyltransferase